MYAPIVVEKISSKDIFWSRRHDLGLAEALVDGLIMCKGKDFGI